MRAWEKDPSAFWCQVDKTGSCWLWRGHIATTGYGTTGNLSRRAIRQGTSPESLSHRVAWVLTHGPIPGGLSVLHRCDVRACVNPDHLFLGTQMDNMRDMIAKGRQRWVPSNLKGSEHGRAKLTEDQVREMRRLSAAGVSQPELAALFGIHQTNVSLIVRRKAWRHVA